MNEGPFPFQLCEFEPSRSQTSAITISEPMATIDTSNTYLLTNSFTGSGYVLAVSASDSSSLVMADAESIAPNAEWLFTATEISPFYRLHTVSGGTDTSLDVVNDNGTSSIVTVTVT